MDLPAVKLLDRRVPHWDFSRLERRGCPTCGEAGKALLRRPDGLPVAYCRRCGLWYVCDVPQLSSILDAYNTYFQSFRPQDMSPRAATQLIADAELVSRLDARIVRLSAALGGLKGRRVVDVGCGLGHFLLAARARGAGVLGVDVSPEVCAFVSGRLGIPVKCKPFEQCAPELSPADAVLMINLIEHVQNPREYFEAAHSVLREGGVLLLYTPNGGGAGDSTDTALNWIGFRVDLEHLQYFSAKTIVRLAEQGTWHIEHLETFGFPNLSEIERGPAGPVRKRTRCRDVVRAVPGVRIVARALHAAVKELLPKPPDPREGSYHLFCILRKAGG